jgi:hypothetical protein
MTRKHGFFMGTTWIRDYEYMDGLQNRNKTLLYQILSIDAVDDTALLEHDVSKTREEKRGERAISQVVSKVLHYTGISDILPLQKLSRVTNVVERAQQRFFQDLRFQFAEVAMPLERFANDVIFEYEALVNANYAGATIGSLVGGAIGTYYLGPVGGMIGATAGAAAGSIIEEWLQSDLYQTLSGGKYTTPSDDFDWEYFSTLYGDAREKYYIDYWNGRASGGGRTGGGGLPYVLYQSYKPPDTRRPRQLIDMTTSMYGRKRL